MSLETKIATISGYVVSGGTAAMGAAKTAAQAYTPHVYFGFSLHEISLIAGMIGIAATIAFQYLNYKRRSEYYKLKTLSNTPETRTKEFVEEDL